MPRAKKMRIFCGTPSYMAPEIVDDKEYQGPPVDVWALGVMLYVMLTGRYPFTGRDQQELFQNISASSFESPLNASGEVIELIQWLLAKEPTERPGCKDILEHPWITIS